MPVTMPDEPLTIIDELAGSAHELFLALSRAGFTESQACQIVAAVIVAGVR
jgi:hypothetical protein